MAGLDERTFTEIFAFLDNRLYLDEYTARRLTQSYDCAAKLTQLHETAKEKENYYTCLTLKSFTL